MSRVFIGVPTYDGNMHIGTHAALVQVGVDNSLQHCRGGSLLAHGFNCLLSIAWNMRQREGITHFALLHADLEPESGWLAKMLAIMQERELGALSVLSPIKNNKGLSSTAVRINGGMRRITMTEAHKLPEIFTGADLMPMFGSDQLAVNSGCLLIDFAKVRPDVAHFNIVDKIVIGEDGLARPDNLPEDWYFSGMLYRAGISFACTRAVKMQHHGASAFDNQAVWGSPVDEQWIEMMTEKKD